MAKILRHPSARKTIRPTHDSNAASSSLICIYENGARVEKEVIGHPVACAFQRVPLHPVRYRLDVISCVATIPRVICSHL